MTHVKFFEDSIVEAAIAVMRTYTDKYDTDSENDFSDREDKEIALITVSRSRWPIRARFSLGFLRYSYIRYI